MEQKLIIQLYELYSKELYLYIFGFCKDKTISEDILQDTFLKAILALSDEHKNMKAWLYKVARNLCIDFFRNKKREVLTENQEIESILEMDFALEKGLEYLMIEHEGKKKLYSA